MKTFLPWKILHLNLQEGIPNLSKDSNYQGIYVVFWWKNIPLGHQILADTQLPMLGSQLANLAVKAITPAIGDVLLSEGFKPPLSEHFEKFSAKEYPNFSAVSHLQEPLKQLEQYWLKSQAQIPQETISVIICTRDRPEQLAKCLQSLLDLSPQPDEIIVVDNAPTTQQTQQIVTQMPGIHYVLESKPGLSIARNTGILQSRGSIIVFTDDDVIVHPNWLTQILHGFSFPGVVAMTGLVLPAQLETESQLAFELGLDNFGWGYRAKMFDHNFVKSTQHWGIPVWRIGAGANMAFRRNIFQQVGEFDPRLGAGSSGCSEDSEMWYRILVEGGLCRYEPTAVVFHSHRQDLDGLKSQMYQYLRGHTVALFIQFERYQHWGNLLRLFLILPGYYALVFLKGLISGFGLRYKSYISEITGFLAGFQFYLLSKHRNL